MTQALSVVLAQTAPLVGDFAGNAAQVLEVQARHAASADLIVFPEMGLSGYPAEDLVLKPAFVDAAMAAARDLAGRLAPGAAVLVGAPWRAGDGRLYNAALLIDGGEIREIRFKQALPNYGVFDEPRVFAPGPSAGPMPFRGRALGVMICEDMWSAPVAKSLRERGAEILIVLNGSPFEAGKAARRLGQARARVEETGLPLIYVNQACGQDDLVFDGGSFAVKSDGGIVTRLRSFGAAESATVWRLGPCWSPLAFEAPCAELSREESLYGAMVMGLRDYVARNKFPGVLIGLSGGIDSALSAAVAVDALGADRVKTFMMRSPYTSRDSVEDAAACAALLGIAHGDVSIEGAMEAFSKMFGASAPQGLTAENIQARARGVFLMAQSNASGRMVLSTGNKSEMAVGYATLYGDMCGGFNVLKDLYKTEVFDLSRWRNGGRPQGALGPNGPVMPPRVIAKPPSAELRPDQKDEDSLPPYPVLDSLLRAMIEEDLSAEQAARRTGHPLETATRVAALLRGAEHKRRQSCPGVKLSTRAFGRDRRYPIVNGFSA